MQLKRETPRRFYCAREAIPGKAYYDRRRILVRSALVAQAIRVLRAVSAQLSAAQALLFQFLTDF